MSAKKHTMIPKKVLHTDINYLVMVTVTMITMAIPGVPPSLVVAK